MRKPEGAAGVASQRRCAVQPDYLDLAFEGLSEATDEAVSTTGTR